MDSNDQNKPSSEQESQEKKPISNSTLKEDIERLCKELNVKDITGTPEGHTGTTSIILSVKPGQDLPRKRTTKEILAEEKQKANEYRKTHPPTLDELM